MLVCGLFVFVWQLFSDSGVVVLKSFCCFLMVFSRVFDRFLMVVWYLFRCCL